MISTDSVLQMIDGKNFVPWATDAQELLSGRIGETRRNRDWIRNLYLVDTPGLASFEGGIPIAASPRGHGKTASIVRRAVQLVKIDDDHVTLRPNSPFINELAAQSIRIPPDQIQLLISSEKWIELWRVVLLGHVAVMIQTKRCVIDQKTVKATDESLKQHFFSDHDVKKNDKDYSYLEFIHLIWSEAKPLNESLSVSIATLIEKGVSLEHLQEWDKIIRKVILLGGETVYSIFVDAIDQSLDFSSYDAQKLDTQDSAMFEFKESVKTKIWLSAQKGFLMAVHKIKTRYPNVFICGTIRNEAINSITDSEIKALGLNRGKIEGVLWAEINYRETELVKIFEVNVAKTLARNLNVSDETKSSAFRLFGFERVSHGRIYGANEHIIDLIRRHTFNSPRDLVLISKRAMNSVAPELRSKNLPTILAEIDKAACDVCEDWLIAVHPSFTSDLANYCYKIERNILSDKDMSSIENDFAYPSFFSKLYSRGLLGFPEKSKISYEYNLHFRDIDGAESYLPSEVPYVALHPAFSSWVCRQRRVNELSTDDFYSDLFVVGRNLKCPSALPNIKIELNIIDPAVKYLNVFSGSRKLIALSSRNSLIDSENAQIIYDDEERVLNFEFICALILITQKRPKGCAFTLSDFCNELSNMKSVGALENYQWGGDFAKKVAPYFVSKTEIPTFFEDVKTLLKPLDLTLRYFGKPSRNDHCAIGLFWRNGQPTHANWTPVDPSCIQLKVNQHRIGS